MTQDSSETGIESGKIKYTDKSLWEAAFAYPDWYLRIAPELHRLQKLAQQNPELNDDIAEETYSIVERAVARDQIILAKKGEDLDVERMPIDRIVIHHTKGAPGMTLQRLNAIQLLRIYAAYYANPTDPDEQHFKGQPIWSGHKYKGQQAFWGYHWLVRNDGTSEKILKDRYIGWHAGNWEINRRSVGICIDDDLTSKMPDQQAIDTLVDIIKRRYPHITSAQVLGHNEAKPDTECPGAFFLSHWKQTIQDRLTHKDIDGHSGSFYN